jgi:hypothetical protein
LTGRGATDDPLLYTGGGTTELRLDLLFDISLAGSSIQTDNVRDLTAPLWRLVENVVGDDGFGSAAVVRLVWGRVWNIPGVVAELAERYEAFSSEGAPRRSWMRMKFLRVDVPDVERERPAISPEESLELLAQAANRDLPPERTEVIEVAGGRSREDTPGQEPVSERLDNVSYDAGFHPSYWRVFANHNDIDDPFHLPPGSQLRVPAIEPPRPA